MKDLLDGGVDTNHHTEKEPGHTGRCVVLVTPDSDRTLCTFPGDQRRIVGERTGRRRPASTRHTSTWKAIWSLRKPPARPASPPSALAEASGVKTAISLSDPNMVRFFKAGVLEMIGSGVDLLFANEDEAKGHGGCGGLGRHGRVPENPQPGVRDHPGFQRRAGLGWSNADRD
jgi:sugar/nucleoside kinase (ribokinase family)